MEHTLTIRGEPMRNLAQQGRFSGPGTSDYDTSRIVERHVKRVGFPLPLRAPGCVRGIHESFSRILPNTFQIRPRLLNRELKAKAGNLDACVSVAIPAGIPT